MCKLCAIKFFSLIRLKLSSKNLNTYLKDINILHVQLNFMANLIHKSLSTHAVDNKNYIVVKDVQLS